MHPYTDIDARVRFGARILALKQIGNLKLNTATYQHIANALITVTSNLLPDVGGYF